MKPRSRTRIIITAEALMFMAVLTVIWADEFIDVPYRLLGAPPTPYRIQEFVIETVLVAMVGLVVIVGTMFLLRRLDRIERFLRVCAWCRKVWLGDRWVLFEEYVSTEHALRPSHGICPECVDRMNAEVQEQAAPKRRG
jgi:hypothetical protein